MIGKDPSKKKKDIGFKATMKSLEELWWINSSAQYENQVLLNKNTNGEKEKLAIKGRYNAFKCRKPGHMKVDYTLLNIENLRRKRKTMCNIGRDDESESGDNYDEEKEIFSCFKALSNKVTS